MVVIKKEDVKKFIDENNLKTMDDRGKFTIHDTISCEGVSFQMFLSRYISSYLREEARGTGVDRLGYYIVEDKN